MSGIVGPGTVAERRVRTSAQAPSSAGRSRRRRLVVGDARMVLSEHARQDKQLLSTLSRLCA